MSVPDRKLRPRQEAGIVALISYPTVPEAANAVGVTDRTLFRWLQSEEFQEAYRLARREAVSQAIGRLQQAATEAVDALRDILGDADAPASARVSAARTVLEAAIRAVELEDLEKRVSDLERQNLRG